MGFATTQILSVHASILNVAGAIFGGDKNAKKVRPENDVTEGAPTMDVALGQINNLLRFG